MTSKSTKDTKATLLTGLIQKGQLPEVKKMMRKLPINFPCNAGESTPLHVASDNGQAEIVHYLIDRKKADVNVRDKQGWTPLHWACHSDQLAVVDVLIGFNADVNIENDTGCTPIDYFVRMPSQVSRPSLFERLFRTMIRRGANVNKQNKSGDTPLHSSAFRGKGPSVALLLLHQANPNMKNKYGETPLHLAMRSGHIKIIKQLIEYKADIHAAGNTGTPLDVGLQSQDPQIVQLVQELSGGGGLPHGGDDSARARAVAAAPAQTPVHNPPAPTPVTQTPTTPAPTPNAPAQLARKGSQAVVMPAGLVVPPTNNPPVLAPPTNPTGSMFGMPAGFFPPTDPYAPAPVPPMAEQPKMPDPYTQSFGPMGAYNPYQYPGYPGSMGYYPGSIGYPGTMNMNMGTAVGPVWDQRTGQFYFPGYPSPQGYPYGQPQPGYPADPTQPAPMPPAAIPTQPAPAQPAPTQPAPTQPAPTPAATSDLKNSSPNTNKKKEEPKKDKRPPPPKNLEHYHLGECIGTGAFGSVYKGMDSRNGALVAIKQVSLAGVPDDELNNIMAELNLLKRLENKYIVKYNGFIKDEQNLNIILELIEGGSLSSVLKNFGGKAGEPLCARYIAQTLLGLDYLHRRGVVHRDIKGANILVDKNGTVKLADFGIAAVSDVQGDKEGNLATLKNFDQLKDQAPNTDAVGSPYWMAPEVILLQGATSTSDIWSVACTIIELLTGQPPFINLPPMSALFAMVQNEHPPFPENISPELTDFLTRCFKKDVKERPSARELLSHPWLAKHAADIVRELEETAAPAQPQQPAVRQLEEFSTHTLANVMGSLLTLQDQFQAAGIATPPIPQPAQPAQPPSAFPPGKKDFSKLNLPMGAAVIAQPDRSDEPDSDEESEEEPEDDNEREYLRVSRSIREYMDWLLQAMTRNEGKKAGKLRKALRRTAKQLRAKFRESTAARALSKEVRELIRQCEQKFPDDIGIDSSDSDYDSQDSFFGDEDDDEFEDEDEF